MMHCSRETIKNVHIYRCTQPYILLNTEPVLFTGYLKINSGIKGQELIVACSQISVLEIKLHCRLHTKTSR